MKCHNVSESVWALKLELKSNARFGTFLGKLYNFPIISVSIYKFICLIRTRMALRIKYVKADTNVYGTMYIRCKHELPPPLSLDCEGLVSGDHPTLFCCLAVLGYSLYWYGCYRNVASQDCSSYFSIPGPMITST